MQHPRLRDRFTEQEVIDVCSRSHLNAHGVGTGHGMFEVGSKFNHSCVPNCTYNQYTLIHGVPAMRVFALKAIMKGEQIFTTYIGGTDMLLSTRERRNLLRRQKAFECLCERCCSRDVLAPLKCPACSGTCWRYDEVEYPWRCEDCPRVWWDSEVTLRERQLDALVHGIDMEMNLGRFPPLQIVQFVLRDCVEDLQRGHYLTIRARLLLEEVLAMRHITRIDDPEEHAMRLENAWYYFDFMMKVVWRISPVVAANLSVLRVRTLLGEGGRLTIGLPERPLRKHLLKLESFLRLFWGPDDEDAALIRKAIARAKTCTACDELLQSMHICPSCCAATYCSRKCQLAHKDDHAIACQAAIELAILLRNTAQSET